MSQQPDKPQPSEDRSIFHYGGLYNRLLDPLIRPARETIVARIPGGSSVLDIGCGTGLLCLQLRREKQCSVVGIDLSLRMLDFARSNNPYSDVRFQHQNATNLQDFQGKSFDYVVVLNVIHELEPDDRRKMLEEAIRVGTNVILFDSNVPLPWNVVGMVKRLIEISFGLDHYPQFKSYLATGGIMGILNECAHSLRTVERSLFDQDCNLLVHITE